MPTEGWAQAVSKIWDLFKSAAHLVTTMCVLSALALFLPRHWLQTIGLAGIIEQYRPYILIVFICSVVYFLTRPFFGGDAWYRGWLCERRTKRRLAVLASDEKLLLRNFVRNNVSTFPSLMVLPGASSLEAEGILLPTRTEPNWASANGTLWYTIHDVWILRYLKKHPELLE